MCCIAETKVRYNWTDVAIRDKNALQKMRENEFRLWVIRESGSTMFRLSSPLRGPTTYTITNAFVNWIQPNELDASKVYLDCHAPENQEFYLIRKKNYINHLSGFIAKVRFYEMVALVCGENVRAQLEKRSPAYYRRFDT